MLLTVSIEDGIIMLQHIYKCLFELTKDQTPILIPNLMLSGSSNILAFRLDIRWHIIGKYVRVCFISSYGEIW